MKVTAVMVVRNEKDLIATTIRYHRSQGVDEVLIVDNGSTDGTVEVLRRMHRRDPAVRWSSEPGLFQQAEFATAMAREAAAGGADWILPIDADEFWWSRMPLRRVLENRSHEPGVGALRCEVMTFAQNRGVRRHRASSLGSMRWRPQYIVDEVEARPEILAGRLSFLELRYPPKYASRASAGLVIFPGNHHVEGIDGDVRIANELMILHAPIRARNQLNARVSVGVRVAEVSASLDEGWHARRLVGLSTSDGLDGEWAACSVANGALDVGGRAHPVIDDDRLSRAVHLHTGGMGWMDRVNRASRRLMAPSKPTT